MAIKREMLERNLQEFKESAGEEFDKKRWNSAFVLYFKALTTAIDLFLLKKEGFIPSNHTQRLELLEKKYPFFYEVLEKNFPKYRDTYQGYLEKEDVVLVRDDLDEIIEELNKTK